MLPINEKLFNLIFSYGKIQNISKRILVYYVQIRVQNTIDKTKDLFLISVVLKIIYFNT